MKSLIILLSQLFLVTTTTSGNVARVTIEGSVVSNDVQEPPLGDVEAGEPVVLTFEVGPATQCCDEENCAGLFCRYPIDASTFELGFGGTVTVGLLGPGEFEISSCGGPGCGGVHGAFVASGALDQNDVQVALTLLYASGGSYVIENRFGEYDTADLVSSSFDLWASDPDNIVATFDFEILRIEEVPSTPTYERSWSRVKSAFRE